MLEWYKPYGVREAFVYSFDEVLATWGTGVRLRNLSSVKLVPAHDTDRLGVYGRDEKGLSVLRGGDLELMFGGIQSDADAIMTGRTAVLSGSGTTEKRTRPAGDDSLPYFAMAIAIKTKNDIGDQHLYCANLMLDSLPGLEIGEESKFVRPSIKAMIFGLSTEAGDRYRLFYDVEFATKTLLTDEFVAQLTANVPGGYLIT